MRAYYYSFTHRTLALLAGYALATALAVALCWLLARAWTG
jgi:hypothetical protein